MVGANCEEDDSKGTLNSLKEFLYVPNDGKTKQFCHGSMLPPGSN